MDQHTLKNVNKMSYPSLFIREPSQELPLLLSVSKKGNLHILVSDKGKMIEIASVCPDLKFMQLLINLQSVILITDKDNRIELHSFNDYLERGVLECL